MTYVVLALCAVAAIIAMGVTFLIFLANGMSDAPMEPFHGKGIIFVSWLIVIIAWAYFIWGR